jgi:ADP-ribosylglycohydrolase
LIGFYWEKIYLFPYQQLLRRGRANVESVEFEKLNGITDDTQLTLATCEAILNSRDVSPESIAKKMLEWYNNRKLSGLGASTLKALRDLQVGAHWGLSGRSGEYAAGKGNIFDIPDR